MNKYIVPPKLNQKLVFFGFTVIELFIILVLILLALFTLKVSIFIPPAAIVTVMCFRWPTTGKNVVYYTEILFKYYRSHQIYRLRECER